MTEEKKAYEDLKRDFNIIVKEIDPELDYGEYFLHAKYWTEKILKMCIVFLVISILSLVIGCIFFITKPKPIVYGSQSNNSLYELETLSHSEAVKLVNEYKIRAPAKVEKEEIKK